MHVCIYSLHLKSHQRLSAKVEVPLLLFLPLLFALRTGYK